MKTEPVNRMFIPSMDWVEIRAFLVRRKWLRDEFEPDIFDRICAGNTGDLSGALMRETSVWIRGYKRAKGDT